MKTLKYENFEIQVYKDEDYTLNSTDNITNYENIYLNEGELEKNSYGIKYKQSLGIKVLQESDQKYSCLLVPSYSGVLVLENSVLPDENKLLACCVDYIYCLELPELNLLWKTKADACHCFEILKLEDNYLVHGELEITKTDKNGEILWQFSGKDIFVSVDGTDIFEIHPDHILVSDWTETAYKLSYDGEVLEEFPLKKSHT